MFIPWKSILDVPALCKMTNKLRETTVHIHKSMNPATNHDTTQLWMAKVQKPPQRVVDEIKESFTLNVTKHQYSVTNST